jgi:co-chaperonin GroES (HSP10)
MFGMAEEQDVSVRPFKKSKQLSYLGGVHFTIALSSRRIEAEEETTGGIIIPDTAKEKPQEGEVIAVGPGGRDESGKLIPIDVKVGDRVLVRQMVGDRSQARRRRVHDHERKRFDGGAGGSWRFEKGRLTLHPRNFSPSH